MSLTVTINKTLIAYYSRKPFDQMTRQKIVACYEKMIEKSPDLQTKLVCIDDYCNFLKEKRMGKMLAVEGDRMLRYAEQEKDPVYIAAAQEYRAVACSYVSKTGADEMFLEALTLFEAIDTRSLNQEKWARVMYGKANMIFLTASRVKGEEANEIRLDRYPQALAIYEELVRGVNTDKYLMAYTTCANDMAIVYGRKGNMEDKRLLLEKCYPAYSAYCQRNRPLSSYQTSLLICICVNLAGQRRAVGEKERAQPLYDEALKAARIGYEKYSHGVYPTYRSLLIIVIRAAQEDGDRDKEMMFTQEYLDLEKSGKVDKTYAPSGNEYKQMSTAEMNLLGNMDGTPESTTILY